MELEKKELVTRRLAAFQFTLILNVNERDIEGLKGVCVPGKGC